MDTITIEIPNPKVRELIANLTNMDLIAILPTESWNERWQKFSASLPDTADISEQDIFDELNPS